MIRQSLPLLAAAALAAALATPVSAQTKLVVTASRAELPVVRVGYADLNLASATGQANLNLRVKKAVNMVCESHKGRSAKETASFNNCRTFASEGARPQVEAAIANAAGGTNIAMASPAIRIAVR